MKEAIPESAPGISPFSVSKRGNCLLAGGYLALLLLQAWIPPLQEPDEGRCASICWDMIRSGDWSVPHLNGIRYYEKPPLFFWLSAAGLKLLGHAEIAVRLPSVLASWLTVLLIAHWGSRIRGPGAGILSALILASFLLFALLARVALVDPLLTLCTTVALYSADRLLNEPEDAAFPRRRWAYGFWIALGLAALVKGPVGVVLPLASLGAFLLLTRNRAGALAVLRPGPILVFLLVALPWFIVISLHHSDYPREFLFGQNLDRLVDGSRFNRDKPLWYHVPVLALGFLPWSVFFPGTARHIFGALRKTSDPASPRILFLGCAVVVPFVILSFAHSKLPHYLLPLCPPMALLVSLSLMENRKQATARPQSDAAFCYPLWAFGAATLTLGLVMAWWARTDPEVIASRLGYRPGDAGYDSDLDRIRRFQSPLLGASGMVDLIALSAGAAGWLWKRRRPHGGVLLLSGGILLAVLGIQPLIAPMGPAISSRSFALKIKDHLSAGDDPVIIYRRYLRGLTYYLERNVILWDALYNEFGHDVEGPEAQSLSLQGDHERLKTLLAAHRNALVVVQSPAMFRQLEAMTGMSFEVLAREETFLLVRPAAPR